jgi:hypothetical protein
MESSMRSKALLIAFLLTIFLQASPRAENTIEESIEDALTDCSTELNAHCSSVTPGHGRLLSCAKAHEDKLSLVCVHAIVRAGFFAETLIQTLNYVTTQCQTDVITYCPEVDIGEERVIKCLLGNKNSLRKYFRIALEDIGRQ